MSDMYEAAGTVWAVFGHRFAVEGAQGRFLADLGPAGGEGIRLEPGDAVTVTGERKPSEIKVAVLTLPDGTVRTIDRAKKHEAAPADPALALAAVRAAGYAPQGEVKRKPKHFEVVGTKADRRHEIHVTLDGTIRKTKPIEAATA